MSSAWVVMLGIGAGYLINKKMIMQGQLQQSVDEFQNSALPSDNGVTSAEIRGIGDFYGVSICFYAHPVERDHALLPANVPRILPASARGLEVVPAAVPKERLQQLVLISRFVILYVQLCEQGVP